MRKVNKPSPTAAPPKEAVKKALIGMAAQLSDHKRFRKELYGECVKALKGVSVVAPVIEVGTWHGGSALTLMAAILESGNPASLITVDPYYFNIGDGQQGAYSAFNNAYVQMLSVMAFASRSSKIYHVHYKVTDHTYMNAVWHTPHYLGHDPICEPRFSFVHLDGGHEMGSEKEQLEWFIPRLIPRGNIVIDDVMPGREDRLKDWLLREYGGRMISKMEWAYK